jgi:hypothetical protein
MQDLRWPSLGHDWTSTFAHHYLVIVKILTVSHRGFDVDVSSIGWGVSAVQLGEKGCSSHAKTAVSALPWWGVKRIVVNFGHKRVVTLQALMRRRALCCVSVLCSLRYRFYHSWGDGKDVLRSHDGANVAKTGKSIPHE